MWWNDEVRRKEVLAVSSEEAKKKRCREFFKEEKVRRCIYQNKKKVNEQIGRKMNEDVNGNTKFFWKEEMQKIWKKCFEVVLVVTKWLSP